VPETCLPRHSRSAIVSTHDAPSFSVTTRADRGTDFCTNRIPLCKCDQKSVLTEPHRTSTQLRATATTDCPSLQLPPLPALMKLAIAVISCLLALTARSVKCRPEDTYSSKANMQVRTLVGTRPMMMRRCVPRRRVGTMKAVVCPRPIRLPTAKPKPTVPTKKPTADPTRPTL
jgi:hypothetical protein